MEPHLLSFAARRALFDRPATVGRPVCPACRKPTATAKDVASPDTPFIGVQVRHRGVTYDIRRESNENLHAKLSGMFSIPLARLKIVLRGKILENGAAVENGAVVQLIGTATSGGQLPAEPGRMQLWARWLYETAPSASVFVGGVLGMMWDLVRGVGSFLLSLVIPPPRRRIA